jgi:pyruvate/2-oxoglutarate dehydrogenase complex dihydrolipoamide acyltransferase (E2) component
MQKIKFSGLRSTIREFIRVGSRCNPIFVTTEINAAALKELCAGQGCSITPVLIKIIAALSARHPLMNSVLARSVTLRRHIYLYDDVDMSIAVEKAFGGERFVTTPVIRQVNRKSLKDISAELKMLNQLPFHERPEYRTLQQFNRLPGFLKYYILLVVCQSHALFRQFFGTVGMTSLGNLGSAYVYPQWLNSVVFGIGSIERKPVVDGDTVTIAPVLPVTLAFNHSVLDGRDAGRILADLRRVIESGDFPQMH